MQTVVSSIISVVAVSVCALSTSAQADWKVTEIFQAEPLVFKGIATIPAQNDTITTWFSTSRLRSVSGKDLVTLYDRTSREQVILYPPLKRAWHATYPTPMISNPLERFLGGRLDSCDLADVSPGPIELIAYDSTREFLGYTCRKYCLRYWTWDFLWVRDYWVADIPGLDRVFYWESEFRDKLQDPYYEAVIAKTREIPGIPLFSTTQMITQSDTLCSSSETIALSEVEVASDFYQVPDEYEWSNKPPTFLMHQLLDIFDDSYREAIFKLFDSSETQDR